MVWVASQCLKIVYGYPGWGGLICIPYGKACW